MADAIAGLDVGQTIIVSGTMVNDSRLIGTGGTTKQEVNVPETPVAARATPTDGGPQMAVEKIVPTGEPCKG